MYVGCDCLFFCYTSPFFYLAYLVLIDGLSVSPLLCFEIFSYTFLSTTSEIYEATQIHFSHEKDIR